MPGGAAPRPTRPVLIRIRATGAGLASVGVASGIALDRAGSGPGGDGLNLDAGPQRQGGHADLRQHIPHHVPNTPKYLNYKIIQ